jgi:hypothetical protein
LDIERRIDMKKYYLTNNNVTEIAFFASDAEALAESQKRNRHDRNATWKAWNEYGDAIYGIAIAR